MRLFQEYIVALEFIRDLLVDASRIRKSPSLSSILKEVLNQADTLLMTACLKPKFMTKDENVVNRILCETTMKVRRSLKILCFRSFIL